MIKKFSTIILLFVCLLISIPSMAAAYVGNSNSMKFHCEGCRWEQKIADYNRVNFDTREEAIDAGYVPCQVCKP